MIFDSLYIAKCLEIFQKGGILYLIERADKEEFLCKGFPTKEIRNREQWSKEIDFFTIMFLTKEDAEAKLPFFKLTEGGCPCCGNDSTNIKVKITEHEFVNHRPKNKHP